MCFTTRSECKRFKAGRSWECVGEKNPFGYIQNAYAATGTYDIPNVRKYDDDWAVMLINDNDDDVNVTYTLELFATYIGGASLSVLAEGLQSTGTQEIDGRGGALGIIFETLKTNSVITYEFSTTNPIDMYIITEEEWTLLEARMGWDYSYSDIETMQGHGEYTIPMDTTWVVAFVNYDQKDISLTYHVTATPPSGSTGQSNLEANTPKDSSPSEGTSQLEEPGSSEKNTSFETESPPMVPELVHFIPTLFIATTVAVFLARKWRNK